MKAVLVLAVLSSIVALTSGETCGSAANCTHIACPDSNWYQDCHTGTHTCTCTHRSLLCLTKSDCNATALTNINHQPCTPERTHCTDGHCRCGFGDFGPPPHGGPGPHNGN